MARYVFDIETDGFLDACTRIHCLVLKDLESGEVLDFSDDKYGPGSIEKGVKLLQSADQIVPHNGIKFDVPVIQKFYPWFRPRLIQTVDDVRNGLGLLDTLVCTRLIWSDIFDSDQGRVKKGTLPRKLMGLHGLEAWGYRLRLMKGDYAQIMEERARELGLTTDEEIARFTWAEWNQEMHDYCIQDVEVTFALLRRIQSKAYSAEAIWLEHRFADIIAQQERYGFAFDEAAAGALYGTLVARRLELKRELEKAFPARWAPVETTCWKRAHRKWIADPNGAQTRVNKKAGTIEQGYYSERPEGAEFTKIIWSEFNPSSRHQITARLKEFGWEPQEFTPSGEAKIDETILERLQFAYPAAKALAEHFLVEKRIGQLAEGDQAWLKLVRKGRIHGSVNTCGAVTGRCTHSAPNVAQTPKASSPYGPECRALFTASIMKVLVGIDLSGIELRLLAHFMARYDDGEYARILLEGDIHWVNVQALGLTDEARDKANPFHSLIRDGAKTFIYAFLYGAGDEKIGSIVLDIIIAARKAGLPFEAMQKKFFGGSEVPTAGDLKSAGKKLKKSFLSKTPALKSLKEAVVSKAKAERSIRGLDGRNLLIRSDHAALNTLLQSAGALIAKLCTVFAYDELSRRGYVWGKDWALVAHIHDELQIDCKKELADEIGTVVKDAMRRAGEYFKLRIRIDGESSEPGKNWYDTH